MQTIWLTLRCNNACRFCPQSIARTAEESNFFSTEAIVERIRNEISPGAVVAFVGGEPTLHPALFSFIQQTRQQGASTIVVQTNGRRLAYVAYTQGLAAAGVSAVDISLHGPTAAIHDYHTSTPGSFVQTLAGLGAARGAGLRVGVTSVITRSNYRHLVEFVRLVAMRGAQAVHLSSVQEFPGGPPLSPSLPPAMEMVAPYLTEAQRVARGLGLEVMLDHASWTTSTLFAGPGKPSPDGDCTEGR